MRGAFSQELSKLAARHPELHLLVGDIGFGIFDQFRSLYPERFINCGVAEANMIGTAAGLAAEGRRPIVYTIIPFLVMRAFEQIRVDLCINNLPVMLVGVGGGLSYDILGPTHHAIEDVAIMRAVPGMTILTPSDPIEVEWMLAEAYHRINGPVYFRLGKGGEPNLHDGEKEFRWATPLQIREGSEVIFVTYGPILAEVLDASDQLEAQGVSCAVFSINQIKPLAVDSLLKFIANARVIVTVEEHNIYGGLGDALAGALAPHGLGVPMMILGIPDCLTDEVGDRSFLLDRHGLNSVGISTRVSQFLTE